ncbi:MAG: thymidine phosphorylase [Candidatus ainarchaeum sp.]|nr:thymidine phosphorylase [Candidatus ainarchaeum sp.]MDD3975995.1 thymidine phosphorylase [Candidatus ainarchaeum sp.]
MTYSFLLNAKIIDISADYPIVILNPNVAKKLNANHLDRMQLEINNKITVCVLDTSHSYVDENSVGLFKDTAFDLNISNNDKIKISVLPHPKSVDYIISKINNKTLNAEQLREIVKDINSNSISEVELSAFITSIFINGFNIDETTDFCKELIEIGDKIEFNEKIILDKHSIGGINGRVSMIITPIISSLGYKIPKTASRSITSAAGTADAMEVLAPVSFTIDEIKEIINKVGGVISWEGKFDLCPVDNTIINIEHALNINPEGIMIGSILSKKKSIGSTHLIIDIPVGPEVKIKDKENGERLAKKFIAISKSLGIKTKVLLTDGLSPCGYSFGPALEAKSVLEILENKYFDNLASKSCAIAGELLELVGHVKEGQGYNFAKEIITSGKALEKFKEIIKVQGGNIFSSKDVPKASFIRNILSPENGTIISYSIKIFTKISSFLGAPIDKCAGVLIKKEIGSNVKKGEVLFEIHSDSEQKLKFTENYILDNFPVSFEKVILDEFS